MNPLTLFLALFFIFNLAYLLVRNVFAVYACYFSDRFIVFIRQKCFGKIIRGQKADLARFENGDPVHRVMSDTRQKGLFTNKKCLLSGRARSIFSLRNAHKFQEENPKTTAPEV